MVGNAHPKQFRQRKMILSAIKARKMTGLYQRPSTSLIRVTGADRLSFIHNQTTNKIKSLKSGEGCETVFVNSTGRTIDLVTVYVKEDEILLLTSPEKTQFLMELMDRYIFPFDKVQIADISAQYTVLYLIGNESKSILLPLLNEKFLSKHDHCHSLVKMDEIELTLAMGDGLKLGGYTLIIPQEITNFIKEKLVLDTVKVLTETEYENLRILQGKPKVNKELTEDYNPLEVGLWQTISFDKGCYIGQETITRLNTYKGVKQRLWGIEFNESINFENKQIMSINDEKIGKITSYLETEKGSFALGYIRTKAGGEGLEIKVNEIIGKIVDLAYISHPVN
ncbi:MAG: folate-binding protein YgfZ [Cyanobacterium sp. T60_A2020_053]|nr:folate-binding protein YgfZ [Cyanobacterium sp. T60_A2020_053]